MTELTTSKMKGESEEKYDDFCVYKDAPPGKRSVGYVVEKKYGFSKGTPEYRKKLYSLKKICTKRCWVERAKISDSMRRIEDLKKRADKSDELNQLILDIVEEELHSIRNMLRDVSTALTTKGQPYSLSSQSEMKRTLILCIKDLNEIMRLALGLSTTNNDINMNGFIDVNATVEDDDKLVYTPEEMKQIQNTSSEPDEEVQEFLDQL